jgi:iron complex transport system substrate-binding protein
MTKRTLSSTSVVTSRWGVSRRRLVLGALAAALTPRLGMAQEATPDAAASGKFPVTIAHALGETTIPAMPERIATTDMSEAVDSLLAIGLQPVYYGLSGGYIGGVPVWATQAGLDPDIPFDRIARFELDPERVLAMNPDLILGTWLQEDLYEQLSGIAPTLDVKASDATTWQEVQRMVGTATGREAEAEAAIAETEALLAEQNERPVPYLDKTVAVAYDFFDELYINGKTAPIGRVLHDFGMTVISPGTAAEGDIDVVSLEQTNLLTDAEIIITPEFMEGDVAKLEANPLFRLLPAVQGGGYMPLSREDAQALYLESTLSYRWGIPRLVDAVIAAAEGRGKQVTGVR